MLTAEKLNAVNETLDKIPLKGKNYTMVIERVRAFRELVPDGCIETNILKMENGIVTMQAKVYDETGKLLATGLAQEKETSSYVNKTSYIENCETSAVGRALGMLGIGVDSSMASAEELVNAITNQEEKPKKKSTEKKPDLEEIAREFPEEPMSMRTAILKYCNEHKLKLQDVSEKYGIEKGMTEDVLAAKLSMLKRDYGE